MNFRIETADSDESRRLVYQLRYRIFVEELKYRIPGANAEEGLREATDAGSHLLLAFDEEGRTAGTMAVDHWGRVDLDPATVDHLRLMGFAEAFGREAIVITRKLLVAQAHRGSMLMLELLAEAGQVAFQPSVLFVFVDCSPYLVGYYEKLGFRRYAPHFSYDETGIISVPLCLVTADHQHLERIGSPILHLARLTGIPDVPEARRYFESQWTAQPASAATAAPAPHSEPAGAVSLLDSPLFEGVDDADRATLAELFEAVEFKPRQRLLEQGSSPADLYFLANGFVEVSLSDGQRELAIATLGPGDLIGEIGFLLDSPRSSSVHSLTGGMLYRARADRMVALLEERPSLAARLYRNLARLLAERLKSRSFLITEKPPL